jgi:cobalamin biosynthesis Mg chelatase CobN
VDIQGEPVIDPTKNVMDMVEAAIQRQDDLRTQESQHVREIIALERAHTALLRELDTQLRHQEAARIDAIRAVDVGNVTRAAEVAATQAATLASQVTSAAEAMRNQVGAATAAAQQNLATSLEPIQTAINDLRKAQYEQQGQKYAQSEGKDTSQWTVVLIIGVVFSVIQIALHFLPK